jgi:isovaleryl-CoA dehydrogenase
MRHDTLDGSRRSRPRPQEEALTHTLSIDELRLAVRDVAAREIAPNAAVYDRDDVFPRALWPTLGELGVLGPTVAVEDGGLGLGALAHLVIVEELSRASAAIGMSYAAHSNLCLHNLWFHGTPDQRARWVPKLLSGEHVGALAMSEADAGSDVLSMSCAATRTDGGWFLNGTKMWITNGPDADVFLVYARTSPPDAATRAITAFVVERGTPGFTTSPKLDKLGMRGSGTCELVFRDCLLPDDHVLGEVDRGAPILMRGLESERLVLTGGPIGIMQAALDLVLPYVRERHQFGRAIGSFGLMQGKLADMYVSLEAARAYAYAVASGFDLHADGRRSAETAGVLLFASERAVEVALEAIQAFGGLGYVQDNAAGRLLRDAKLYTIGAGTNEIRRMLIGRTLTGKLD